MIVLLTLGLFCVGFCVTAVVKLATMRRMRVLERLTHIEDYGFAAEPPTTALPVRAAPNGVSDFVGRIGELFGRYFGGISEEELRAALMAAGMYTMSPRTLLGYRVVAAILLPIVVLLLGSVSLVSVLIAVVTIVAGWMLPLVLVRRRARIRLREIDRRLPDLIDLLVVTVEAGLGFTAALRTATDQLVGSLSDELRLSLQEQTMGLALDEALANLVGRADTPGMRSFVRAMVQGERLGISTGQIMRNLSVEMRKRRRKSAEEQAQKAPIKMLFPLVFLIFPALFIVLLVPALIQLITTLGSG
jgi:tight adherence protein C